MFKEPNGPLYITTRVTFIPSRGTLVDPSSIVNVITKEHLFNKGLNRDTYNCTPIWIQTCNGFLYFPHGSITLKVTLLGKSIFTNFVFTPTSNQFQVKLVIPWITSIQFRSSPIHKCLKFPHDGNIININNSLYKPSHPQDCAEIDF